MPKINNNDWEPFKSKLGMVRLILSVEWDPIGLFGHQNTLDEYDGYALRVLGVAESTRLPGDIADLLLEIEMDWMGRDRTSGEARLRVGHKILFALSNFDSDYKLI